MPFLIQGIIKKRDIPAAPGSKYQLGLQVLLDQANMRWKSSAPDMHWADNGIHAEDVVVQISYTSDELEMLAMIYPYLSNLIADKRIIAEEKEC